MHAQAIGCATQFADQLPWVNRSSGNLSDNAQRARIRPGDGRILAPAHSANLPRAWKRKVAIYAQFCDRLAKAAQNIAEAGKITCGAFCQNHTTRAAAGAGADMLRFEDAYDLLRSQMAQPTCSR